MPHEVKIVLCMAFTANMAYWQLAPFFPKFVRSKNIDKIWVGIAMSCYATLFLLSSLFTGKVLLKHIKRINGCFIGAGFVIINLIGFAVLDFIEGAYNIIGFALLFQIFGGIGNGLNTSSSMALLSSYEENRDVYIGYLEVCGGLGALIGPMVGSGLYYLFGFMGPFLGLGCSNFVMVLIFWRKKQNIPLMEDILRRK